MRIRRFGGALFLVAISAQPCVITRARKLWAKQPGSESILFAFERNGRVGFVDQTGKIIIQPTIVVSIEDVRDFSNGLAWRSRVAVALSYLTQFSRHCAFAEWFGYQLPFIS